MMKDDALSPIVAFMLLLMVVVSIISVLNAYYIPTLKQQAEIEHLKNVEDAFTMIEVDLNRFISFKENGLIKERVPLGGGDVIFSPVRSSGTLRISTDIELGVLRICNVTGYCSDFPVTTINLSYRPVNNFWMNQGYEWSNGSINVTKGKKTTWFEYADPDDASQMKCDFYTLLTTPVIEEKNSSIMSILSENVTVIACNMTITPGKTFMSGNGVGGVKVEMKEERENIPNATEIRFDVNTMLPEEESKCITDNSRSFSPVDLSFIKKMITVEIIQ